MGAAKKRPACEAGLHDVEILFPDAKVADQFSRLISRDYGIGSGISFQRVRFHLGLHESMNVLAIAILVFHGLIVPPSKATEDL